jgi:hypothetical protein
LTRFVKVVVILLNPKNKTRRKTMSRLSSLALFAFFILCSSLAVILSRAVGKRVIRMDLIINYFYTLDHTRAEGDDKKPPDNLPFCDQVKPQHPPFKPIPPTPCQPRNPNPGGPGEPGLCFHDSKNCTE